MISKTRIEKKESQIITPVQYWVSEEVEVRCCNARGLCRNSTSTYSSPQIMLIKHTKGNKTIDISLPFKKCNDLLEIIQEFMDVNSDVVDN